MDFQRLFRGGRVHVQDGKRRPKAKGVKEPDSPNASMPALAPVRGLRVQAQVHEHPLDHRPLEDDPTDFELSAAAVRAVLS